MAYQSLLRLPNMFILLTGMAWPGVHARRPAILTDWLDGKAEILTYRIDKVHLTQSYPARGEIVTESLWANADGAAFSRDSSARHPVAVLGTTVRCDFRTEAYPVTTQTSVRLLRDTAGALVRQDALVADWQGSRYRQVRAHRQMPMVTEHSSSGADIRLVLDKSPVITEEMLWTWLRLLGPSAGLSREFWMLEALTGPRLPKGPRFAQARFARSPKRIGESTAWLAEVTVEDGTGGRKRYEFWLSAMGTHPVVRASFPDGTQWTLERIERRRYWPY